MRIMALLPLAALVSCQDASSGAHANQTNAKMVALNSDSAVNPIEGSDDFRSDAGPTYHLEKHQVGALPQNADLKMLDGDLVQYSARLCHIDILKDPAKRCDVYVQNDPAGNLIGYAAVLQNASGVSLDTATTLNEIKSPGESCALNFNLYQWNENNKEYVPVANSSNDFQARIVYSYWDRGDGQKLVSEIKPDGSSDEPENGSQGVWFVEKKDKNLRIQQERWNYCYTDENLVIDEVFKLALSFIN